MPAVKVYAKQMKSDMKETISKKFLDAIQSHLNVPIAEIFFFELEKVYANDDKEHCLLEVEGPDRDAETIEQLGKDLCNIFMNVCGVDCHVSVLYHPNLQRNVIEANGSLVNLLKEKRG